jgi:hypothetical protein
MPRSKVMNQDFNSIFLSKNSGSRKTYEYKFFKTQTYLSEGVLGLMLAKLSHDWAWQCVKLHVGSRAGQTQPWA